MDDDSFRKLLEKLDYSWRGYRKVRKGVKKRIVRHMLQRGCGNMDAYLQELEKSPAALRECRLLMTVSISRFFRDLRLWEALRTALLPGLLPEAGDTLKVWSAGCAGGEEVYSFRMVWDRMALDGFSLPELAIIATDVNPACIERAKEGCYLKSSFRELPEAYQDRCFEKLRGRKIYSVRAEFRSGISWEKRELSLGPPDRDFSVVFLRNSLLTYYLEPRKTELLKMVVDALRPSGILIIGAHERIPETEDRLKRSAFHPLVYVKQEPAGGCRS